MSKLVNTLKLTAILAIGFSLPMHSEAAQTNSKTLFVKQSVGNAPGYTTQFNVYTSTVGYTPQSGMSMNINGAVEVDTTGISKLNVIASVDSAGQPLDQATLLSNANYIFNQSAPIIGSQLTTYMKQYGIGTGIFNYTQELYVKNNPNPFYLVFQEAVDSSGRPRFGAAQLVPTKPAYEYGIYTSKAVAQTLPSSFAYPSAGTVQYQQVDQQMNPLTALTSVNVNGAFDAPVASPTAKTYPAGCKIDTTTGLVGCDPDYGLKCLINHASDPQCPSTPINGFTDFIGLLNANGASGGYLDYVRTLTPVYTTSTDANGNLVQTAKVSVSVDTRTFTIAGYTNCTLTAPFSYGGNPFYNGAQINTFIAQYPPAIPSYSSIPNAYGAPSNSQMYSCQQNGVQHILMVAPESLILSTGYDWNTGATIYSYYGTDGISVPYGYSWSLTNNVTSTNVYREYTFQLAAPYYYMADTMCDDGNGNLYSCQIMVLSSTPTATTSVCTVAICGGVYVPGTTTYSLTYPGVYSVVWYGCDSCGGAANTAFDNANFRGMSGGTFHNTGHVGYQVQSSVDRYFVYPDGTYALINHITTQQVAPTQYYDWTVTLPQGATSQSYTNMIIDPFKGQQVYDWRNDTVNHLPISAYLYVHPLVVQ